MLYANLIILGLVVFMISIIWPSVIGAPWVPTSREIVDKMLNMADVKPDEMVYDLGCGDGRFVITAAKEYGARAVGVEIDPLRLWWSRLSVWVNDLGDRVEIKYGNIFNQDVSEADVVICYLLQKTNNKLERKFVKELKPGTRIVSNTFTFKEFDLVKKNGESRLYVV